jgi:hypothetical protein
VLPASAVQEKVGVFVVYCNHDVRIGLLGAVVSISILHDVVPLTLPAISVDVTSILYVLSDKVDVVIDQFHITEAVVVYVTQFTNTSIFVLGSAVPDIVGVLSFVSIGVPFILGDVGGTVSTIRDHVVVVEILLASSSAYALIVYVLSARAIVVIDHAPHTATSVYVVHHTFTYTVVLGSAVPDIVGVLSFVSIGVHVIVGALGETVSIVKLAVAVLLTLAEESVATADIV